MPETLVIGPVNKGLQTDRTPFVIDNDAFPILQNAYQWRGRVKKKRGTILLGRLQRTVTITPSSPIMTLSGAGAGSGILFFTTLAITGVTKASSAVVIVDVDQLQVGQSVYFANISGMTQLNGNTYTITAVGTATITINVDSTGFTTYVSGGTLSPSGNVVPGTISLTDGTNTYTDSSAVITGSPAGSGTVNYSTGVIAITGGADSQAVSGSFDYYPCLPVMGLEDFQDDAVEFASLLAFDTVYSYALNAAQTAFHSTSFYKTTGNAAIWNGYDYQQFWTTNYENALWAVNGDTGTNQGFNFGTVSSASVSGKIMTFTLTNPYTSTVITNLIVGDVVWFNELAGSAVTLINGYTASITNIGSASSGVYQATFAANITLTSYASGTGIAQLLTNSIGYDGVRWYDGDPTTTSNVDGWVNFMPPLASVTNPNYLVGAQAILPYKDRLLFFAPWVASSAAGLAAGTGVGTTPVQLQDTVIYSWNGTPYYTVTNASIASLVPSNAAANVSAWYQNSIGFGGFIGAGTPQSIISVTNNEDVLILGFTNSQRRLVYTANDLIPFIFYTINSELGALSTFSSVNLDRGPQDGGAYGLSLGSYGLTQTDQTTSSRIDLAIPDQIFDIPGGNEGFQRVCAQRDYRNEWVYFTVPSNQSNFVYPTQTLLYNYRDNSWALFWENFTTYGRYRKSTSYTWATLPYTSWDQWNEPWNSGTLTSDFPSIIGGNQQGFILIKGTNGTGEGVSAYISAVAVGSSPYTARNLITSPNHCLMNGDYIYISGCLGTTTLNNTIRQVAFLDLSDSATADQFYIDGTVDSSPYLGLGVFIRLVNFQVQTKQFPFYWPEGRQARIGTQKYLMTETSQGAVVTYIYVDQDANNATNLPPYVPSAGAPNDAIVYNAIVPTYPEYPQTAISGASIGTYGDGSTTTFSLNIFTLLGISGVINPGTLIITVDFSFTAVFTDNGAGTFTVSGTASSGTIDYATGAVTLVFSSAPSFSAFVASLSYYYNLSTYPVSTNTGSAQIWHRQNTGMVGDSIQIGFTMNDSQMRNNIVAQSEFELHAIIIEYYPGPTLSTGLFT